MSFFNFVNFPFTFSPFGHIFIFIYSFGYMDSIGYLLAIYSFGYIHIHPKSSSYIKILAPWRSLWRNCEKIKYISRNDKWRLVWKITSNYNRRGLGVKPKLALISHWNYLDIFISRRNPRIDNRSEHRNFSYSNLKWFEYNGNNDKLFILDLDSCNFLNR